MLRWFITCFTKYSNNLLSYSVRYRSWVQTHSRLLVHIHIGLLVHPYWPAPVSASRSRNVRWNTAHHANLSLQKLKPENPLDRLRSYDTSEMEDKKKSPHLYLYARKMINNSRSNLAIPEEESFLLNSAAIVVTRLLCPSVLKIFVSKNLNTSVFWFLVAVILWRHDSYYVSF